MSSVGLNDVCDVFEIVTPVFFSAASLTLYSEKSPAVVVTDAVTSVFAADYIDTPAIWSWTTVTHLSVDELSSGWF